MVSGDINSIKSREDRRGKDNISRALEMEEFRSFIDNMKLLDVQVLGNVFTWIKPNGKACSRLDCILLSEGLISKWGVVAQEVGKRDTLNHKPVWLKSSGWIGALKFLRSINSGMNMRKSNRMCKRNGTRLFPKVVKLMFSRRNSIYLAIL